MPFDHEHMCEGNECVVAYTRARLKFVAFIVGLSSELLSVSCVDSLSSGTLDKDLARCLSTLIFTFCNERKMLKPAPRSELLDVENVLSRSLSSLRSVLGLAPIITWFIHSYTFPT